MEITQAKLKELLDYNPETGVFVRKTGRFAGNIAGAIQTHGYVMFGLLGKVWLAHRLAWIYVHGVTPNDIDHKDRVKHNNRISNLRECTNQENQFNRDKPRVNTSGYKGVILHRGRWTARIKISQKVKHIGYYDTPELASEAYIAKAKELHGEFYCER